MTSHPDRGHRLHESPVIARHEYTRRVDALAEQIVPYRACRSSLDGHDRTVTGDARRLSTACHHPGPGGYAPSIAALSDHTVDVRGLVAEAFPLDRFDEAMAAPSGDVAQDHGRPGLIGDPTP